MPSLAVARPPGQVFTPASLAQALVRQALRALDPPAGPLRVLEPAAGTGRLVEALAAAVDPVRTPVAVQAIEADPQLVPALQTVVNALPWGISGTVSTSDFFLWDAEDVQDTDDSELLHDILPVSKEGAVDLVIANPPWLRESGNAPLFRQIRQTYPRAARGYHKDCDLHQFFWWPLLRRLRPGGVLAMWTPAYWLDGRAGAPLRRMLVGNGRVVAVWRSGLTNYFPGARVEVALTVWRRQDYGLTHVLATPEDTVGTARLLPGDGSPWLSLTVGSAPAAGPGPELGGPVLGDRFRVIEGVHTGADRLRAVDAGGVVQGVAGAGILVCTTQELEQIGLTAQERARWLWRRYGHTDRWVLRVCDGDLPRLDAWAAGWRETRGEAAAFAALPRPRVPWTALEAHLVRYAPVLSARAEILRARHRSWYATLWPRPGLTDAPRIVVPKWATRARFSILETGALPMTDHRVLVPREPLDRPALEALVTWWNGDTMAPWFRANLKQRGRLLEWYGGQLLGAPLVPTSL